VGGWELLWTFVHVVSWSTYVGGALVMELVWRPAQQALPPSQTAVACQWMGRRYRWLSLVALLAAGVSGVARLDGAPDLGTSRGRLVVLVVVLWALLLGVLGLLAVAAHPALHVRTPATMSEDDRAAARQEVRRAIRRMDLLLRLELTLALIALLAGVLLRTTT
jgi:uncharacterized membrane protein